VILVFGTVCLDRVRRISSLPAPGGYVEVESETVLIGGEAANTACALHAWGDAPVLAGNPLGRSAEANKLRSLLRDRGFASMELLRPGVEPGSFDTPVCDIYVTDDGERTMFGRGFTSLDSVSSATDLPWQASGWFTAEPNMEHLSRSVVRQAQEKGMKVYVMDFVRPGDPIFAGTFWQSSTNWAGARNDLQENLRWLRRLVDEKGCFGILSDGSNGFVAGSPTFPVRAYPPFPAPAMVDATGAGDMFRAGMLHSLSRGLPFPDCLRFASAAGSLKCGSLGATTRVPTLDEIEAHVLGHPEISAEYG
jgi:sugar/nucleoside kinase (ribokinase family)